MPDAVFVPTHDTFTPTDFARGPWDSDAMHGSAPAGLLARVMERHEPMPDGMLVRISVDLLAPVPIEPLEAQTEITRPGKRVQVLEAELRCEGKPVARATGLRIRRGAVDTSPPDDTPPPDPETGSAPEHASQPDASGPRGFIDAVELRYVSGSWEPGPATVWHRFTVPLVDGEEVSPLVRLVVAADFANGIAAPLPFDRYLFINPDLNVHLHREPIGEWVCLEAACVAQPHGVGQSDTHLWDTQGLLGRSVQALYVDERR